LRLLAIRHARTTADQSNEEPKGKHSFIHV
jgi:hypothetical protein